MNLNFNRTIQEKNFLLFFTLSFFLTFLCFIITKGFIKNTEFSDKIFLSSCILSYEIAFLIYSNNIKSNEKNDFKFNLSIVFLFIFIFIIWNNESVLSYQNLFFFLLFHSLLTVPLLFFININKFNYYKFENYLIFIVLSFF